MMYFSELHKDEMFLREDNDLELVRRYTESHSEACRLRMLNQDNVLRRQVYEPYQSYNTQGALLKGFNSVDSDKTPSWSSDMKLSLQADVDPLIFKSLETGGCRLSIPVVELMQSMRQDFILKQKKPLELQLPADQYIFHANKNFHHSERLLDQSKEGLERSNPRAFESELSLDRELKNVAQKSVREDWFGQKTQLRQQIVIDLEEPTEWTTNRDLEVTVFPNPGNLKPVKSIPCFIHGDTHCKDQEPFHQGFKVCSAGNTSGDSLQQKQQSVASCALDLNEIPTDDFPFDLNDPADDPCRMEPEITQVSYEKSEVEDPMPLCSYQSQNIHEKDSERSPASYTSCCITDNDSTGTRTVNAGTETQNLNLDSQSLDIERGSGVRESELEHVQLGKNRDSDEADPLIQIAAMSLINISTNCSDNQDSSPQAEASKSKSSGGTGEQPECSCDSYELITLRLNEMSPEESCVSSQPLVEPATPNNKDFSSKLRRGRRMKDFQRDILPGLASLSRHEIREDINILEGVLRSREYQRMMGEKFCKPARNRRSGLRQVRRRNLK